MCIKTIASLALQLSLSLSRSPTKERFYIFPKKISFLWRKMCLCRHGGPR